MPEPTPARRFVTAELPADLHDAFREIAKAEYRTISAELRRLVERRVEEWQKEREAA